MEGVGNRRKKNYKKGGGFMRSRTGLTILVTLLAASAVHAAEPEWGSVEGKTIKVFYPGVTSWEFLKGDDHGKGGPVVSSGEDSCATCHVSKAGKYDIDGDNIITGKKKKVSSGGAFEPEPIAGMKGFKDLEIKAAYDAENIYMRFSWEGAGASVKDPSLGGAKHLVDEIAVQLNANIKAFKNYGCYITCHDDQEGMPKDSKKETKLYGFYTREKELGNVKPKDKLDGYLSKGQFIDLWEAFFEGDKIIIKDHYILDSRREDKSDVQATGSFANGKYTVVLKRKLVTGEATDIALKDGSAFNIGIAVYDNKQTGRKHYTSFPVSIGLGAPADVAAKKF